MVISDHEFIICSTEAATKSKTLCRGLKPYFGKDQARQSVGNVPNSFDSVSQWENAAEKTVKRHILGIFAAGSHLANVFFCTSCVSSPARSKYVKSIPRRCDTYSVAPSCHLLLSRRGSIDCNKRLRCAPVFFSILIHLGIDPVIVRPSICVLWEL